MANYTPGPMPTNPLFQDLTGQRFGIVTATRYLGKLRNLAYWEYRCDCGHVGETSSSNLKKTRSCGCLYREGLAKRQTTHGATVGGARPDPYHIWAGVVARCEREGTQSFRYYGGRGIKICDRWRHGDGELTGFECFVKDMGPRPSPHHSIDRIDNDGNYEPGNCRWATMKQQQRNRTGCHFVDWNGERITLQEACDRARLSDVAVHARLGRGWSLHKSLTTPSPRVKGSGYRGKLAIRDLGVDRRPDATEHAERIILRGLKR